MINGHMSGRNKSSERSRFHLILTTLVALAIRQTLVASYRTFDFSDVPVVTRKYPDCSWYVGSHRNTGQTTVEGDERPTRGKEPGRMQCGREW